MSTLVVSLLGMGGLALFFALFLFFAYTRLAVKEDPRVEAINDILPQANCGGCGYPGCLQYAEAIVKEGAPIDKCAPGGQEVIEKIAKIMGLEAGAFEKKVAEVMCGGTKDLAVRRADYIGPKSCREAHLWTGGDKACEYGCLGFGDCVEACPFDAMYMGDDGLPRVIYEKCTGCGVCVEVCPRGIMQLVPESQRVIVKCVNHDPGAQSRKVCKVACIACTKCVKTAPEGSMKMDNYLAVILDYKAVDSKAQEVIDSCPTFAIVDRKGELIHKKLREKKEGAVAGA